MKRHELGDAPDAGEVPTNCPSCRSRDLKTTSKVVTSATYWRCQACGEVWNVRRQREGSRYVGYPRFGR